MANRKFVPSLPRERRPSVGGHSPWDTIQHIEAIEEDGSILSITTAGHGGLWVSKEKQAQMPAILRPNLDGHWYEEDCEWAKVHVAFPNLEGGKRYEFALVALYQWNHPIYMKHFDLKTNEEAEAHVRARISPERNARFSGKWNA